jgi:transaldolase
MRKAGVDDYLSFAKELLATITDRPISFEVTSDDVAEMERQALTLHALGDNVYVKIPITDTTGTSTAALMARLAEAGVSINATALTTLDQVKVAADALGGGPPAVISVFAGRIADTGVDPVPMMTAAKDALRDRPELELLWASPREILNLIQAERAGCDIITMTPDLLAKVSWLGRDLGEVSLATVQMFRDDAVASLYEF